MNTTAKVILFPQLTKKGYPIKIRVYQKGKSYYVNLKYYIAENQKERYWNSTKNELRKSYPNYEEIIKELEKVKEEVGLNTPEPKIIKTPPKNNSSFIEYCNNHLESLKTKKQYGLAHKTTTTILHLKNFIQSIDKTDLLFNELNVDLLNDIQLYFIENDISPITQKGYFEKIRSMINKAIKENKYNPERHPFLGFEFMKIVVHPKCLEPDEFKFLKNNDIETNRTDNQIANTLKKFLFQYYTYGMRVSDLLLLTWSNIYEKGSRIKYTMFKTKHDMDIALNPALLNILYHYTRDNRKMDIAKQYLKEPNPQPQLYYDYMRKKLHEKATNEETKNQRIFSNIPITLKDRDLYVRIQTETSAYNRDLKDLSNYLNKKSNYNFNISSHMARHTFAYLSMINGDSIYFISKALNHKSIKTTENYLRGFKSRELDGKFFSKELTTGEKHSIDNRIKEFILMANYEQKKKLVDFINMI